MTVSTVVDHNDYTGNGITTSFPYTFRIFKKTDLTVSVIDLSENITVLVLDTDYTVTNAGGYEGGSVVLTTPLANGWQISIARDLEATQETDLRNQGKFFAEVHEDAFDKLTMLIQQVGSMLNLALRKPTSIANWYDAMNNYIRNLKDPRDPQDAATKKYTDDLYNQFSNLLNTIIDTIQNGLYGYNEKRSFELGNTLLYPNDILLWESNGQYYRWDGPLPKVVPPGSTPGSTGGIAEGKWRNVVGAGLSPTDAYHSCLIEGYDAVHVSDVTGAYNLFGVALKSRNVVAKGLITYSCDTGLIIKSDAEFSTAKNVVVTGHVNVGNGVCSQGVWIIATTAQMERILVSNLESTGTQINCRINASSGVANDIVINGVNYSGATYADFVIDGGASGKLYNVSLNGVSAVSSAKLASVGYCEQLTVNGFYGSITNAATVNTAFEVSSGVGLFVGSSMHLAVNYGASLAGLSLGNGYVNNRLSAVKAKVLGSGKPRPGYTDVTVSGTAQALTVGDSLFGFGVANISTAAASSSYSSINVNDSFGQPISPGFKLTVRNGSANSVVFNHNPGTGGIANNGAAAKTVSGGDIIEYTFDGTNWRQTPSIS